MKTRAYVQGIILLVFAVSLPLTCFSQASNYNCTCLACGVPCDAPASAHRCDVNPAYSGAGSSSSSSSGSSGSSSYNSSNDYKALIIGSIFNAMMSSSNDDAEKARIQAEQQEQIRIAEEKALQQKIKDEQDLLAYNQLMAMYKTLPDGNADLDFKTLDGDAEQMASDAQRQFSPDVSSDENITTGQGTNFFGTLTEGEINTLLDPDSDPNIVDLREAQSYIVDNLKTENESKASENKPEENPEPEKEIQKPDCAQLKAEISTLVQDRAKFKKNLDFTLAEYDAWKKKKDDALWNAATDGISFAATSLLDYVKYTRESAIKIKDVLLKNEERYIAEKIFTPDEILKYKNMLDTRISNFSIASFGQGYSEAWEYYGFVKNLIQSYASTIGNTDVDYIKLMNSPVMQELKSEFPIMDATQFLASKAIDGLFDVGSITKGPFKMSYVGLIQLAIDETYNITDWYLSYKNFCTNRDIIGKELESAKYLQGKIDEKISRQNQFCHK
jgi:hypothetical protein